MNKLLISAAAVVMASPAFASVNTPLPPATAVPEISALEGTAALAAVAAIVLLAWERRRRSA